LYTLNIKCSSKLLYALLYFIYSEVKAVIFLVFHLSQDMMVYESMKTWFHFGPRKPSHLTRLFSGLSPLKALNCLVVVLVTMLVEEQEGDGELGWPLQYCVIFSLHGVEFNSDSLSVGRRSSTSIGPYFETKFVSSKMGIK